MGYVYAYGAEADDFTTTGLVGALYATECEHEEIAGGESAITLTHPFDEEGKWKALQRGNILKCLTRVRTTPEISNGTIITTVEVWTVKATASAAQRAVFSKKSGGKKKKVLKAGTTVAVVQKPADGERYKIKAGRVTGWIAIAALQYDVTETTDDIETVAAPWIVKPQLFRIQDVEKDTDGEIKVYAPHISYDLAFNNTRYENSESVTAVDALAGVIDGCDFPHDFSAYTDIGDSRTGVHWINISPMEAILDPDEGILKRWNAELIRDDYEIYLLRSAGRNRGARVEYGKNLLGVNYSASDEGVVTAILPTGQKKDGSTLYLTDDVESAGNYVLSDNAGDYPFERAYVLKCDNAKVGTDKVTLALARERMREQAAAMFADELCDVPDVSLKIEFVQLGDSIEYQQYKDLEPVFLYDTVMVADKPHGIEAETKVKRIVFDCLKERVIEAELGDVEEGTDAVYNWQIPSLDGGKLRPGTVPGEALEEGTIPENKLDPELQEAFNQALEDIENAYAMIELAEQDIEAAQGMIDNVNGWLDGLEAQLDNVILAVGDNADNIAGLQITANGLLTAVRNAQGDISTLQQTAASIRTAIENAEGDISTLTQTAASLRTAINNTNGDVSTLQQTASSLATAITNAEGDISTLQQTAESISSSIQSMNGQISSIRQTANSISAIVGDSNSGLVSQVQQLSDRVAIKIKDESVNGSFEAVVGAHSGLFGSGTGISLHLNGAFKGAMVCSDSKFALYSPSGVPMYFSNEAGMFWLGSHETSGHVGIICDCSILPRVGNYVNLGGDGQGMRWKKLYCNSAVDTSDMRHKHDISALEVGALLRRLKPVRYRLNDAPEKVRYGFVAQDVIRALAAEGLSGANLIDDDNPEHLGLVYKELIAPLVKGWQEHERTIDDQNRRITALESRLAALEARFADEHK